MTFLNSYALWFLPAILLPVIIHLLSKRKAKRVDFSSLRFLKALEQDALKTFNIKQLILLVLRTLLILVLILAFARPTIQSGFGFTLATRPQTLTVVLVDNTASLRWAFEHENIQPVLSRLSALDQQQSEVNFLGWGDSTIVTDPQAIQPTWSVPVIVHLNQFLRSHFPIRDYARRELILVTDGQLAPATLDSLAPDWWVGIVPLTGETDKGITHIKLPSNVFQPGDEYSLQVAVATNLDPMQDEPLELWVNEHRVNQVLLNHNTAGPVTVDMKGQIEGRRAQEGYLAFTPDAANYNNRRYFVLQPGTKIEVGVIAGPHQPDIWYILSRVLAQQSYNIKLKVINGGAADGLNLQQLKTLIWETNQELSTYQIKNLVRFVHKGGQVILIGAIKSAWHMPFDIPVAVHQDRAEFGFPVKMTRVGERAFPQLPLQDILQNRRLVIKQRYLLENTNGTGESWLTFGDDTPLLSVKKLGKGRLIWLNTELDPAGSNWPVLGVFPALLMQLIQGALPELDIAHFNRSVGDPIEFKMIAQLENKPLQVQIPDGRSRFIQPDSAGHLAYNETRQPGFYRLYRGSQELDVIAVNIDPAEAIPASVDSSAFDIPGTVRLNTQSDLVDQVLTSRQGSPLWPGLLLLALMIFLAENTVARIPRGWRQN